MIKYGGNLETSKRSAETEVRTESERNLMVWRTTNIELAGGGAKFCFVAVGRRVDHDDRIASADLLSAKHGVDRSGAHEIDDGGGPSKNFFDRARDE